MFHQFLRRIVLLLLTFGLTALGKVSAQSRVWEGFDTAIMRNCIVIMPDSFTAMHEGEVMPEEALKNLGPFLEKRREFGTEQLSIVLLVDLKPKERTNISNLLKQNHLSKFKFVDMSEPEAEAAEPPMSSVSIAEPIDSNFLVFRIEGDSIRVEFHDKQFIASGEDGILSFLRENKTQIDPDRIAILALADMPYKKFEPVINALSREQFFKFQVISVAKK